MSALQDIAARELGVRHQRQPGEVDKDPSHVIDVQLLRFVVTSYSMGLRINPPPGFRLETPSKARAEHLDRLRRRSEC